jgi:hypothetical protein
MGGVTRVRAVHQPVPRVWRFALDLLFLLVFWTLFFWPLLGRREYLVPYDMIDQHYMFRAFFHRALVDGESPWWAPFILGGYPIVADPLTMAFYPPALLMDLLSWRTELLPYYWMEFFAASHVLWAALGTYALALVLWRSRLGGLVAALAFAFGGFFAWHLPHLSLLVALSWVPWILLGYRQVLVAGWRWWLPLTAMMYGLLILAGHAQAALQTALALGGLGVIVSLVRLGRSVSGQRERQGHSDGSGNAQNRCCSQWLAVAVRETSPLWQAMVIIVAGASLAAVQLFPSLELAGYTERKHLSYEQATLSSLQPHWLLTLVLPNLFSAKGPAPYWGSGDPAETNFFVGLLPLLLTGVALVRADKRHRPLVALIAVGGVVMLVLALGGFAWPYRLVYDFIPGFDHVRRPVNFAAFTMLAIALLVANGVRMLVEEQDRAVHRVFERWLRVALAFVGFGVAAATLVLVTRVDAEARQRVEGLLDDLLRAALVLGLAYGILGARARDRRYWRIGAVGLLVLVAVDIASVTANASYRDHRRAPDSYIGQDWAGAPDDTVVRWLLEQQRAAHPERFRILPLEAGSIWLNGPLVWGLDSASGYSVLWPVWYRDLFEAATSPPNRSLLDLLGVRYVLSSKSPEDLFPPGETRRLPLVYEGAVRVYENADAWPRVWLAACARLLDAHEHMPDVRELAALRSRRVLLGADAAFPDEVLCPAGETSGPPVSGSAEIVTYTNTRVVVQAQSNQPAVLVLMDSFYPGWHVSVDGREVPLYQANRAFRATLLPAGEHTVEFRYVPRYLFPGALVSGLGALAMLVLLVMSRRPHDGIRASRRLGEKGGFPGFRRTDTREQASERTNPYGGLRRPELESQPRSSG